MSSTMRGPTSPVFFVPLLIAVALILYFAPPQGGSGHYNEVAFVARAGGLPAEGAIKNYKTDFQFDPASPETASLRMTFDILSTSTGSLMADRAALSDQFLDAERYPTAELTANNAKPVGDGKYVMEGQLTLKGVTKPIRLPVSIKITEGNKAALRGEITVNRLDFGLGPETFMGFVLDNDVKVRVALSDLPVIGLPPQTAAEAQAPTAKN